MIINHNQIVTGDVVKSLPIKAIIFEGLLIDEHDQRYIIDSLLLDDEFRASVSPDCGFSIHFTGGVRCQMHVRADDIRFDESNLRYQAIVRLLP